LRFRQTENTKAAPRSFLLDRGKAIGDIDLAGVPAVRLIGWLCVKKNLLSPQWRRNAEVALPILPFAGGKN